MNEIPAYSDLVINSDNDVILRELLDHAQNSSYNYFWGPEYIIMNEKSFIDNNSDHIIEVMIKSRTISRPV